MSLPSPAPPRSPWQLFYGGAHRLRARWYTTRAKRLPRPVVSIGNLCWGGGGKTPFTAAVAAHLRDRGHAVCILSRGYARQGEEIVVVSQGAGPLLDPAEAGDEPYLLAEQLPGVALVVGADRYQAGLAAQKLIDPPPSLFLLDDGFSHLALHRDLDLVLFPAADPFAGGRLFPAGRLREPLAAMARAHAAILTGAQGLEQGAELAQALRPFSFAGPGFASFTRPAEPRLLDGQPLPPKCRVLLVSAIARPENFAATANGLDIEVAGHLAFPDHHAFPDPSLARIAAAFRQSGATAVLVTAKDRVKLAERWPEGIPLAELPIRAEPEAAFWQWLDGSRLAG
jgi:tetraacyldisaccharide 4'-kinase